MLACGNISFCKETLHVPPTSGTKWTLMGGRAGKGGRDGVISDHVCGNTITSTSRLDRCMPAFLQPLAERLYTSSQGAAVMDGPRSGNSPGGVSITHQHPPGWAPTCTTPPPSQCDKAQMQIKRCCWWQITVSVCRPAIRAGRTRARERDPAFR